MDQKGLAYALEQHGLYLLKHGCSEPKKENASQKKQDGPSSTSQIIVEDQASAT